MGRLIRWTLIFGVLAAGGYFAWGAAGSYLAERRKVTYETAEVDRGPLEEIVRSTGEVQPVLSVTVGSFVSGPIIALHADFNDAVSEGDLLAEIDPRLFEAAVAGDRAGLATSQAQLDSVKAQLQQAVNDERRAMSLRKESADYISQAEVDRFHFSRMGLEAQLEVAEAGIQQARARLENSEANLNYTKILAPTDGIIIDRKIDPGQTLASQFQAPELFVIAPQMRERVRIFASVDEADIGLIREAQAADRPVRFTVYAYPGETFEGRIEQIRFSSAAEQNVVTYPVVVTCPNPDLKLLPGMTADLSFLVDERQEALRVPNAALRYFPPAERVREEDRWLVTGKGGPDEEGGSVVEGGSVTDDSLGEPLDVPPLKAEAAEAEKSEADADARHVWRAEGQLLRAVEVRTGISDGKFTEILSGDLEAGDALVTGQKT